MIKSNKKPNYTLRRGVALAIVIILRILIGMLFNLAIEGLKSALLPIFEEKETKTISAYSSKIEDGSLQIEKYIVVKGDTIDGIIYNYVDRADRCLEEVRYDIRNINAAKDVNIQVLHPGDVIYLPVY